MFLNCVSSRLAVGGREGEDGDLRLGVADHNCTDAG